MHSTGYFSWATAVALAASLLTSGCGEDTEDRFVFEDVSVTIFATVDTDADTESEVGHALHVYIGSPGADPGSCLPTDLAISVNGRALDPPAGETPCGYMSRRVGPFLNDEIVSIRLEHRGKVALAEFAGVFPGASVTTDPPRQDSVASGGEIALSVPAAFAWRGEGPAAFFWLDYGTVFRSYAWAVRRGDRVIVPVPPQGSGRAIVFAGIGLATLPVTVLRCQGLRDCGGETAATLGPVSLRIVPPGSQGQ